MDRTSRHREGVVRGGVSPREPSWPVELREGLERFLPRPIVEAVLQRAARRSGLGPADWITTWRRQRLIDEICSRVGLFLEPGKAGECKQALRELASGSAGPRKIATSRDVPIESESDMVTARTEAIIMARERGASGLVTTRAATIVSELSRNIVLYAVRGIIRLRSNERYLEIVAEDQGPGIPHLDEVLAGTYTSGEGLGLGLIGTERLATYFDVESAAGKGTRVTVRIDLSGAR